ncbi:MAG: hypothetical protein DRG40_00975 [Deltaproteobacteria bacterium]|nr:MAG: hypothetical protein DRG40_00975 [Deltaproteobacteria bacterium]
MLRDSFVAENLLLETTHNDPDRFSPKTPLEILEKIRQEGFKEYLKEREEHEKTKKELQREKEEKKKFYDLWGKRAEKISNIVAIAIGVSLGLITFFSDFGIKGKARWLLWLLSFIVAMTTFLAFLGIFKRDKVKKYMKNLILKFAGIENVNDG